MSEKRQTPVLLQREVTIPLLLLLRTAAEGSGVYRQLLPDRKAVRRKKEAPISLLLPRGKGLDGVSEGLETRQGCFELGFAVLNPRAH